MRSFILLIGLSLAISSTQAQNNVTTEGMSFDFGATVGLNAAFPVINSISINEVEFETGRQHYQVGYLASVFCRINMDRFFIQPSFSWQRSDCDMILSIPSGLLPESAAGDVPEIVDLKMRTRSLQVPIMIGYHIIKEAPYGLSFMVGPNLKYNYNVSYTSDSSTSSHEFVNDNTPYGIGIAAGIGVSIWQLFFDFTYEFGINQVESDFKEMNIPSTDVPNTLRIDKRTNMMSFSFGLLF